MDKDNFEQLTSPSKEEWKDRYIIWIQRMVEEEVKHLLAVLRRKVKRMDGWKEEDLETSEMLKVL